MRNLYDLKIDRSNVIDIKPPLAYEKATGLRDNVAKTIFYGKNGLYYIAYIIAEIRKLDFEYVKNNIRYVNNVVPKTRLVDKDEASDIVVSCDDVIYNIEINNSPNRRVMERNAEYIFRWYSSLVKGGKGNSTYQTAVQININNFSFKGNQNRIERYTLNSSEYKLLDKIEFVQIYVPNIIKACYNNEESDLQNVEKFVAVFALREKHMAQKIGKESEMMLRMISEEDQELFKDIPSVAYDKEWAMQLEYEDRGLERGEAIGLAKRQKESQIKIAKNMLDEGCTNEFIAKITGLSPAHINKLAKKEFS